MYAVTGTRTKRPQDMERYRELQSDPDLIAFHQRSLDGFSPQEIADAVQRNHAILARMEAALDGPWLVGDHYSLADIAWFPNVLVLHLLGFPMERYPAVRRWASARPCGADRGVFAGAARRRFSLGGPTQRARVRRSRPSGTGRAGAPVEPPSARENGRLASIPGWCSRSPTPPTATRHAESESSSGDAR